jgi:hypothetical protein
MEKFGAAVIPLPSGLSGKHPSGAKALWSLCDLCGTTKVVPFQNKVMNQYKVVYHFPDSKANPALAELASKSSASLA